MKLTQTFLLIMICTISYAQLNTKMIATKYGRGVVKVILMDPELEKTKPGAGYLSRGSGFFVTNDGYIITNRHVVETCVKGYVDYDYKDELGQTKTGMAVYSDELIKELIAEKRILRAYNTGYTVPLIQVFNGTSEDDYSLYKAEVIAVGMGAYDGALLKVISDEHGNQRNFNFTSLPIGNSDIVSQGEQFCVFGFPAQFNGGSDLMLQDMSTLSTGIMSGHDYVFNKDYGYLKTDAEIHPGNSGGPVFNEENKVIGIATSKGVKTGIGLVGGINGMYFVSAIDPKAHKKLEAKGLKNPERAISIETNPGIRQPIKTPEEINTLIGVKTGGLETSSNNSNNSDPNYNGSQIYFSNISVVDNDYKIPGKSKRYSSFTISRKKGGVIYVYVDTYPAKLNTDKIIVLIDELKNGKYEKLEDLVFNVTGTLDYTYFPYTITKKGSYKFSIYSNDIKLIGSGSVEVLYK